MDAIKYEFRRVSNLHFTYAIFRLPLSGRNDALMKIRIKRYYYENIFSRSGRVFVRLRFII